MTTSIPPALIFLIGALLIPLLRGKIRSIFLLLIPVLGLVNLYFLPDGESVVLHLFDQNLTLVRVDALSRFFGILFHIAALVALIYSLHVKSTLEQMTANRPAERR